MITRILFALGAMTALMFVAAPDVAMAGPCGKVQYSTPAKPAAEPSPAPNPFEQQKASPACRQAARTGSLAAAGTGALATGAILGARFVRGGSVGNAPSGAGSSSAPPPALLGQAALTPQLHAGNAPHATFMQVFPELIGRNFLFDLGTPEVTNNCQSCCVTAEHIMRGEQAIASPRYNFRTPWDLYVGNWRGRIASAVAMPGARWEWIAGYEAIARRLAAAGDGARAIVFGERLVKRTPMSHVFNAVNRGGVVCFVDLQTGTWARPYPYRYFEILYTN